MIKIDFLVLLLFVILLLFLSFSFCCITSKGFSLKVPFSSANPAVTTIGMVKLGDLKETPLSSSSSDRPPPVYPPVDTPITPVDVPTNDPIDIPATIEQSTSLSLTPVNQKVVKILDKSPHEFGVMTINGFKPLILVNTPLPTKIEQQFSTNEDFQHSVKIQILQDTDIPLGTFMLSGIPRDRAGRPKIMVTFEVNEYGILTVSAMEMITKKVQLLSLVSTSINTVEPMNLESNDPTCRKLTSTLLGTWFWEKNRDISTQSEVAQEFEGSDEVKVLVEHLNQCIELQKSQCKSITEDGVVEYDSNKLNTNFQSLINSVVLKIRPPIVQADLRNGLSKYHYSHMFNDRIPKLITQLTAPGWISLDLSATTGTAWAQRATASFASKPFTEELEPQYFWASGGHSALADNSPVVRLTQRLNQIARYNSDLYLNEMWGQVAYRQDYMNIIDYFRNLMSMVPRRGSAEDSAIIANELAEVLEEIIQESDTNVDPRSLSFSRVLEGIREEFD